MKALAVAAVAASLVLAPGAAAQDIPCEDGYAGVFECEHVHLLSHLDLNDLDADAGSGHWGWTDGETGREYALMGVSDGTAFVDITDPVRPVYLGKLPTHTDPSVWRELKVYSHFVLSVSEANGHGMQVFDLTRLRDVDPAEAPVTFEADVHYDRVGHIHNVAAVDETGFAYIVGNREAMGCNGGLHMVDMSDPLNPRFAGCFAEDGYTHDVVCHVYEGPDARYHGHEICFASNEDTVTIVDVTDKKNPVMLSQALYPNIAYTHQGWFTEDMRYFIVNDELDEMRYGFNTRTLVFDFEDLENPQFVGDHRGPTRAVAHNLYVRGDMVYMANYRRGLEIARIDDASTASLTNVAFFDSFPEDNATQFGGAWNVYPFYESGTVTIADMNRGLFMVRPFHPDPLALSFFGGWPASGGALLQWTVAGDAPARFTVERETDGAWEDVGYVRGAAERRTYRLFAALPAGEHTVRLRSVDRHGMSAHSDPVVVSAGGDAAAAAR
jgi:choice-of-anchor B domain-containing protein